MKFARFVFPIAALLLVAGARKPDMAVRFYVETSAVDSASFAQPVKLPSGRDTFVSKMPVVSEHDIVGVVPMMNADGTMGCLFKINEHARLTLEATSGQNIGKSMLAVVAGRPVIDMLIDQRISDGWIPIPRGLDLREWALIAKKFKVLEEKTPGKGRKNTAKATPVMQPRL